MALRRGVPAEKKRILQSYVFDERGRVRGEVSAEVCEYALALSRLGGGHQALTLLDAAPGEACAETEFARGAAWLTSERHTRAAESFGAAHALQSEGSYERLVTGVNLVHCFLCTSDHVAAAAQLEATWRAAQQEGAVLLLANLRELRSRLALARGDADAALSHAREALDALAEKEGVDALRALRVRAHALLMRDGAGCARAREAVEQAWKLALALAHGDSLRELDLMVGEEARCIPLLRRVRARTPADLAFTSARAENALRRLGALSLEEARYAAEPFLFAAKGERRRERGDARGCALRSHIRCDIAPPLFLAVLRFSRTDRRHRGASGRGVSLKRDGNLHRLLRTATADLYRARPLLSAHAEMFPGRVFVPALSYGYLRAAAQRLNAILEGEGLAARVRVNAQRVEFHRSGDTLRKSIPTQGESPSSTRAREKNSSRRIDVFAVTARTLISPAAGDGPFSRERLAQACGLPQRTVSRLLASLVRSGRLEAVGNGKAVRYVFTRPASGDEKGTALPPRTEAFASVTEASLQSALELLASCEGG